LKRRRRGRPRKKRKPYSGPLKILLEFLNYNPGGTLSTELRNCLKYIGTLENQISLKEELAADLRVFIHPRRKGVYDLRSALCHKINEFRFPLILTPNTPIQLIKNELKEIGAWNYKAEFGVGAPYESKREFYVAVAEGMVSRELTMLRRCPHCERFFIADEERQMFCCREHARAYYDNPTLAKERAKKSREHRAKKKEEEGVQKHGHQ
jgi:hypothetical protein